MNYMNFTTREEYLSLRAQWSAEYQMQVNAIRKAKLDFKQAQREFSKGYKEAYSVLHRQLEARRKDKTTAVARVQELLYVRVDMKNEAQRQYLQAQSVLA